ncbi:MAG TPA: alpha-2-macroglobulin, partial [Chitinophagaceae bacterium]|nr:alpha-2-macroglobulin [Chitinophagaceae bacterium]
IQAGNYWFYFQQHRWQIYDRTATVNFNKTDVATWGIEDFHHKISELYLASVKQEKLLQQTKLEPFDAIIIKGNVRYLRPTLFDLLANRAIEYFSSDERDIKRPAYAFEVNDPLVFADAATFAGHKFETSDTFSLYHKALQLYQRLISFHLQDAHPAALIDADINRLGFANRVAVMDNKDTLYENALRAIVKKYPAEKESAQALFLVAQLHFQKAQNYQPLGDTTGRYEYVTAKAICEQVTALKDSSEGRSNCEFLLREISRKSLKMEAERVNVPGMPFRMLVNYRNISKLYLRVVKMDRAVRQSMSNNQWEEEYWQALVKLPVIKTFTQDLPATNDYQEHAVEIKVDALPIGAYAIIASADAGFSLSERPLVMQSFHVSNIAYVNNEQDFFVLHRETGKPLGNASVQIWYPRYDYNVRKWINSKGESIKSDENGHFSLLQKRMPERSSFALEITTASDHLFMDDQMESYPYYRTQDEYDKDEKEDFEKDMRRTFLFTDRSIYRPGQTVYFKGITVTRDFDTRQAKIVMGMKTM